MKLRYFGIARVLVTSSLAWCCAGVAFADDLTPPSWRASDPSWTVQEWEFFTPQAPLAPDGNIWGSSGGGYVNPFGLPTFVPTGSASWTSGWGSRVGVYALVDPKSMLLFDIPNDGMGPSVKQIRAQITWNPVFTGTGSMEAVVLANGVGYQYVARTDTPLTEGFIHSSLDFVLPICPLSETLVIAPPGDTIVVDQVVVDTICAVPEPTTCTALGLGLAGLVSRKLRKSK